MWNLFCLIGAYNSTLPRYFSFNKFLSFKVEICCCSVTQPCPTLCDPMDCSTPGLCPSSSPSVSQFCRSVMSNSLQPHEPQHTRPPCPSPTPRVHANSCPLSRWCHPTILSSVIPFSSCPQSFPVLESFPMSWFFASGGQSIGASASASASVLPMNTQDWSLLGLIGLISLQSKGLSRVFSNTAIRKHQFFSIQPSLWSNSHIHTWLLEKP